MSAPPPPQPPRPVPTAPRRATDELARRLFAPLLRPGGAFGADGGPEDAAVRLVSLDAEQGLNVTLRRDDTLLLFDLGPHDAAEPCYARTERFNVAVKRVFEGETPLTPADRAVADRVVALVRHRERLLPEFERPAPTTRSAVRLVSVDRVLIPEGRGHYYLNPYAGCAIGCPFCWVAERADLSRALDGQPRIPWGRWVDVKVNAAEVLAAEVRRFAPGPVRLSPVVTDPYQPLERRWRITRQCLEVLLPAGFSPVVLTRAARVSEDIPLLQRFARKAVGVSLPSDDDRLRRAFEPGGDPVDARLETLERLRDAGIPAFALVQPVLPLDVERLADRLAPLVKAVRFDRHHGAERFRDLYVEHGVEHALAPGWYEATAARLRAAFTARGVRIDDLDDMVSLLA
jgi:DNA repair photolyase